MDMWTIRSADRLRCPRVAAQHGDCSPSTTCPQGQQQPKRFKIGFTKAVNSCVTSTGQVNLPSTYRPVSGHRCSGCREESRCSSNFHPVIKFSLLHKKAAQKNLCN